MKPPEQSLKPRPQQAEATTSSGRELLFEESLRGGQMWSRVLRRGQRLRITDAMGGAQVAALFYNADRPLERYNMPDTLKSQHIARIAQNDSLLSDMGRVLCSVVDESVGWHDTISGHMTRAQALAKYGQGTYQKLRNEFHRNTRDNFLIELGKYELGRRDLHANVNFFVKLGIGEEGNLGWIDQARQGHYVELRADMNTLVVLSNTPHPADPSDRYAPKAALLELFSGMPAGPEDPCRVATSESKRAFALTDGYFT